MKGAVFAAVVTAVACAGCGAAMQSSAREAAAAPPEVPSSRRCVFPDFGVDVATGAGSGRAYVAGASNKLVIVDPTAAAVAATVNIDGEPYAVAVTPDSRRAYVVDLRGEEIAVVDIAAARQKTRIAMGTMERPALRPSAAASRDGRRVYVANTAKDHLYVIDTTADEVVQDLFLDFHPSDVAVRSDGRFVFVVGCRRVHRRYTHAEHHDLAQPWQGCRCDRCRRASPSRPTAAAPTLRTAAMRASPW